MIIIRRYGLLPPNLSVFEAFDAKKYNANTSMRELGLSSDILNVCNITKAYADNIIEFMAIASKVGSIPQPYMLEVADTLTTNIPTRCDSLALRQKRFSHDTSSRDGLLEVATKLDLFAFNLELSGLAALLNLADVDNPVALQATNLYPVVDNTCTEVVPTLVNTLQSNSPKTVSFIANSETITEECTKESTVSSDIIF